MGSAEGGVVSAPIPLDGGWGWMVVLGSFLAYFVEDGWSYSFGVFYPKLLEQFEEGKGKTAIIGALMYGSPMVISPVVCALTSVYGCRLVGLVGGFITAISFLIGMFATSVGFLCFSTGIIASIGLAMCYLPALLIVTYYFEVRRGLATGLAVTGSGLGAFAFPPLLEFLLSEFGLKGTFLIVGGICFNLLVAAALYRPPPMRVVSESFCEDGENIRSAHIKIKQGNVYVPRLHRKTVASDKAYYISSDALSNLKNSNSSDALTTQKNANSGQKSFISLTNIGSKNAADNDPLVGPKREISISSPDLYFSQQPVQTDVPKSSLQRFGHEFILVLRSTVDKTIFKSWPYLMFCGSSFILFLWSGVPYIYLVDKSILIGIKEEDAAFLLSIMGISRIAGQIIFGFLGDLPRVNTILLYAASICVSGVATLFVPLLNIYALLGLYAALYGFTISVTYSLMMVCVVELVGLSKATNAFGFLQLCMGISTLIGSPIAGWLFDWTGRYDPSFYTAGSWILLSGLLLLPLPHIMRQDQPRTRMVEHNIKMEIVSQSG